MSDGVMLGMPALPPPVLSERRKTRQLMVGNVGVGSEFPVSVQSMTTTLTSDVNATLQQIAEPTASGCDIVRVACPSQDDADALPAIAKKSQIPVIADIHFQPKYVFAAIEAGCAAVRVNPGNIRKFDDQVKEIAAAAKDHGTPIRIGVNAGSLDKRLLQKYGKATPEALVESALWEASLFAEHDFHDIKISVKHNDPVVMIRAYKLPDEVTAGLSGMEVPLRVAVMGCVVNGPGEAREADLGVASGNGKGQIFVKGEVVKTVPEHAIVETLIEEAMKIAETMESTGEEPVVSVG